MTLSSMVTAAAESTSGASGVSPVVVGIVIFIGLIVALFALLMFGAGRPHS
jgi:hypothetical protein